MTEKASERIVLIEDILVMLAAVGAAHLARQHVAALIPTLKPTVPVGEALEVVFLFLPTWAWCAASAGLHNLRTLAGPPLDLARAVVWTQGAGIVALAVILTAAQAPFNRSSIGIYIVVSTVFLSLAKVAQRLRVRRQSGRVVALVVGQHRPEAADELDRLRGRRVEHLVEAAPAALRARLRLGSVDEVVLPAGLSREELRPLLIGCEEVGVPALVEVERVDLELARPRTEVIGTTLYLSYQVSEPDRPTLLVKALVDRLAAAAGLVVTLPVLAVTAAAIRLSSPGPVLFVQSRGGLNGRPFRMLKFRTMRVGAEDERSALLGVNEMEGPVFKMANDPRVTPLGRFLRRMSIDELPQLVNVLLGQMSMVGPRPLPLVETASLHGVHRRRLSVRPGITGLWQVSGRSTVKFEEWMALDLQYIDRWSLGLDVAILARTLPTLLSGRGAK